MGVRRVQRLQGTPTDNARQGPTDMMCRWRDYPLAT
jgi:hypothetical protein